MTMPVATSVGCSHCVVPVLVLPGVVNMKIKESGGIIKHGQWESAAVNI